MSVQELKSSLLWVVHSAEAGGQVWVKPVAVSWEWLPGAPRSNWRTLAVRADLQVNLLGRAHPSDTSFVARGAVVSGAVLKKKVDGWNS